ncbi:MAG: ABC transporter ATP-binding protein [Nitrospirae bacterium]|nr:ABC transporter ATP-binding protein [Nitrospirota bacterium]
MISVVDVRKVFNAGKANEYIALDGVQLDIEKGRITVIKGPSGSGKTTLLSVIGCMARPSSGRIRLSGVSVEGIPDDEGYVETTSLPERFLTQIRRKTFGFIFQQYNLVAGMTVIENVMLPAYPTGEAYSAVRNRAEDLLKIFGLYSRLDAKVQWLSGGESQRVSIVRALINNPSGIIADEPTAHLDTKLSSEFMNIIESLNREGRTIIIASHDPVVCESSVIHRVVEMRDGKVIR